MFLGDRTEEIFYRATNREITAIFTCYVPGISSSASIESYGAIIQDKQLFSPKGVAKAFTQAAVVLKFDDSCIPAVQRSPIVLEEIRSTIHDRTHYLNDDQLCELSSSQREALFDCEDVIGSATGIPPRIDIDFSKSAQKGILQASTLPFPKAKDFILDLAEKLDREGGGLHDAVIGHKATITAIDYYQISRRELHPGWRRSAGQVMLDRATNALIQIGIPSGNNPPAARYDN